MQVPTNVLAYGRTRCLPAVLEGVQWIQETLDNIERLSEILQDNQFVFHLADKAIVTLTRINTATTTLHRNLTKALNILNACRSAGIGRIVFASSGGTVYGSHSKPLFHEHLRPKPVSTYGISRITTEYYLQLFNHSYAMRNIILRIANPFGPFQKGLEK